MRARVRPRFLLSTRITERESRVSRFQYQVEEDFFVFAFVTEVVGWKDQRLCRRELERIVSRPLMLSSMSEVVMLWKRIVARRALVLSLRVSVRRGLLEMKDGMWTASRVMARMGVLVLSSRMDSFPRRIGTQGMGPANASDCVGDKSWGLECGGSGSGWIWGAEIVFG